MNFEKVNTGWVQIEIALFQLIELAFIEIACIELKSFLTFVLTSFQIVEGALKSAFHTSIANIAMFGKEFEILPPLFKMIKIIFKLKSLR